MTMSGYEIAQGGVMQSSYGPVESIPGHPQLFVAPGAAVLIGLIFYVAYVRRRIGLIATLIQTALAGVGWWQIFAVLNQLRAEYGDPNRVVQLGVQTEYGFWMTVFGMGGVLVGSLLSVPDILRHRAAAELEKPPPRPKPRPRHPAGYRRAQLKRLWQVARIPLAVLLLLAGVVFFLNWNAASSGSPTWSPAGQRRAVRSDRDGNGEIYVMDADGGNQRRLTHSRRTPWLPAWPWVWW